MPYPNRLLHQQAIAYAAQLRDSKIILIDGQKLTQFMIDHDVVESLLAGLMLILQLLP